MISPTAAGVSAPPSERTLQANLAAIARLCPDAARAIERAAPRPDIEFIDAADGLVTARVDGRLLSSAKKPGEEAERFASSVDVQEAAGVAVLGFGAGHHVGALAERVRRDGAMIVFEPDVGLLRAVLERIDHSAWMHATHFVLATAPDDGPALSAALKGLEGLVAMGMEIVEHAPSRVRIGANGADFGRTLARVVSAVRTNVVTTMMQTDTTVRNELMNLDRYAGGEGVADLQGCCAGRPGVVVAAGPSLERNMRLLARPGVRERVVIVAVQTALKPLLKAGIRPHFVTALDHHEISRRFYEGLTASDVEGVTLIAEPKANPAILDAFPGAIRCPGASMLDLIMGVEQGEPSPHGAVPAGATVAHLAYYFARFLGCDPVALIGQDLGFTDGQYYAAGAAIHDVWAGELNPFRTLEMLEWERIVRSRSILRKAVDHLGRPIYTDEQMSTYLAQFERDFKSDESKGLTTIDATEGGVRKAHTSSMDLEQFLMLYAPESGGALPSLPRAIRAKDGAQLKKAEDRLRSVRADVWKIAQLSRRAAPLLTEMAERQEERALVEKLIDEVYALRDEAVALQPAYELTHRFNQTGAFNRARTDRSLRLDDAISPMERQAKQIERDRKNLEWLAEAADEFGALLDAAVKALHGGAKRTRDEAMKSPGERLEARTKVATAAMIVVDPSCGGLGAARDLGATIGGENILRLTLRRLARMKTVRRAVLLTSEPDRVRELLNGAPLGIETEVVACEGAAIAHRRAAIRSARLWAPSSWRGALGGLTICDEALAPEAMAPAMERFGIDAALVVGADWALVDPALCDAVMERHIEKPERHRLAFCQAAPGLAGCVVDRHVMTDLAKASSGAGVFASLGGLLGFLPVRPKADPIATPVCVQVPPAVRDAGLRFAADTKHGAALFTHLSRTLGGEWTQASAERIVEAARGVDHGASPRHVTIELTTERLLGGARRRWAWAGQAESTRAPMTRDTLAAIIRPLAQERDDLVVTFAGAGDPLLHPQAAAFVSAAKEFGAAGVHVRTDLLTPNGGSSPIDALLASGVDVLSADLLTAAPETYRLLTGTDRHAEAHATFERLFVQRAMVGWLPMPWLVARLTRCDAVYEQVEDFYTRWLLQCGGAVIDAMPCDPPKWADEGERIRPLPLPRAAAERARRERMLVLCDGTVVSDERDLSGSRGVGRVGEQDVTALWRTVRERREAAQRGEGDPRDLWTGA